MPWSASASITISAPVISLLIVPLHSLMPLPVAWKIKKGRKGPLRTATFADGLAIPGGAPTYDYEGLSNKIAHPGALSAFHCHCYRGGNRPRQAVWSGRICSARIGCRVLQIVIGDGRGASVI